MANDEIYGSIGTDLVLDADIVKVKDDVKIEEGVTLTIMPGTTLQFDDYYVFDVYGTIKAIGTREDSIYLLF